MAFLKRAAAILVLLICLCIPVSGAEMGSIEVKVPGGSITLYCVEDAPDRSPAGAQALAEELRARGVPGQNRTAGDGGTVRFDGLADGVYLLAQWEPAEGYLAVRPFFVELGAEGREVCAKPKTEKVPDEPQSPQTGDAFQPAAVPVMWGSLGALIIWITCFHPRKKRK